MSEEADATPEQVAGWWAEGEPTEVERREGAYAHRGQVVEGSGEPVEPRRLGQAHAITLSADDAEAVMTAAERLGMSVQDFIRRSAVANARRLAEQTPAHTCGGIGCRWCDPLGETSVTFASTGLLAG